LTIHRLLQNWLATADLRYHRVEFLAVFRDAAIGGVVAIPTGGGVESIELGEMDGGNVTGDAVD
jgi:hypothetical protein